MNLRKVDQDELRRMYTTTAMTLDDIAAHFKVTRSAVTANMRILGIDGRRRLPVPALDETALRLIRTLIEAEYSEAEIAAAARVTVGAVRRVVADLRRNRQKPAPVKAPEPAPVKAPEPDPVPVIGGHPFWTSERDALVLKTGGRHRALAEAAAALGTPITRVRQRWFRLSAG